MAAMSVIVTVLQCALLALCKGFAFCMQINAWLLPFQVCALPEQHLTSPKGTNALFLTGFVKKKTKTNTWSPVLQNQSLVLGLSQSLANLISNYLTHNCSCKC